MRAISASHRLVLLVVALATIGVAAAACNDSADTMTGPAMSQPPAANLTGNWTGTFHSDAAGCSAVPITASLTQSGSSVSGHIATSGCGLDGKFEGTLSGSMLVGAVKMPGCTGGAVTGSVSSSRLAFQVGEMVKTPSGVGPDGIASPGGNVTMSR
jgi:hypothetical protein